ncbi:hypothetical protein LEP1GSC052_4144 [Leptospira kmetyi serovar Malaysia str. Bejo-Iso9]|nr:hypothetical protein LEP1GSC052_4144 [Leptospira kmetyi serovar Malaysia str. Bejo-Iso9]
MAANQISNLGFTKLAANLEIKLSLKFIVLQQPERAFLIRKNF